jgi:GxxExxY protein
LVLTFSAFSAVKSFSLSVVVRFGNPIVFFHPALNFRQGSRRKVKVEVQKVPHATLTSQIIGSAIKVHRKLGPGLLESAYEACLAHELEQSGFHIQRQKAVSLIYGAVKLECGFRADLVVDRTVIVEIKCKEALHPVDQAQLLSHLRLLDLHVGLLINFHVLQLKDGIKRMVNNYRQPADDTSKVMDAKQSL